MRCVVGAVLLLAACQPQRVGRLAALADSAAAGRRLACAQGPWVLGEISLSAYKGAERPVRSCVDSTRDTLLLVSVDAVGRVLEVARGMVVTEAVLAQRFDSLATTFSKVHGRPVRCQPVEHPDVARELYWNADSQFVRLKYDGGRYLWWERALGTGWCESGPPETARAGA